MDIWESTVKVAYSFWKPEDYQFYKRLGAADFFTCYGFIRFAIAKKIIGFRIIRCSEKNGMGKDYPILHMKIKGEQ